MITLFDSKVQKEFLGKLLTWYKKHGRHDMPWRKTEDPYAILISEFMLQQTTVATVRPYYDRFLKKFPTVRSLAQSNLNEVLALWSGLGYYARARNLWAAMKKIEEEFEGEVPADQKTLQQLPGIGYYTSGAISSLAFNKPAAVLDGNIIRVLMRLLGMEEDPRLKAVQVLLRKLSLDITTLSFKEKKGTKKQIGGPRDVVLALMDLGATLCAPRNPDCPSCPVAELCMAKKYGKQNEIPFKVEKEESPTVRRFFGVIQHKGKWLVGQRPKEGLFGGLWEFLGVDAPQGIEPVPFLEAHIKNEFKLEVQVKQAIPAFEHQLTHRNFLVRSFLCEIKRSPSSLIKKAPAYDRFRWVTPAVLTTLGVSAITKRILSQLVLKEL